MTQRRSSSDPELIRRAREGSVAAVEALYRRYLPSVWRYVRARLGGDPHAAEDVVAETFLAAVRGLRALDPDGGSVHSWLVGIARHKLGDHRRRARREPAELLAMDPAEAADPLAPLEAAEREALVARAMAALPDEQRLVLEWKYCDGLTVGQIADRIARTQKAAEALLYRARKSFRVIVEGLGPPAG